MNMLFTFNAVYHKQGLRIFISQSDGIQIRLVFALVRSPSHPRNESNIFMIFFQCATRWIVMFVQSEAKQGYKKTEKQESVLNSSKFILFMGNWGFAFTAESSEWLLAACLLVDTRRLFCLLLYVSRRLPYIIQWNVWIRIVCINFLISTLGDIYLFNDFLIAASR